TDQTDSHTAQVIEKLIERRLIVATGTTAEIIHDALLHAWDRLRGWLDADSADSARLGQFLDDAADWDRNGRTGSYLYRGERLTYIHRAQPAWQTDPDRHAALIGTPQAFLHASARAHRQAILRRRFALAVLSGLTVLALILASLAYISA